MSTPTVKDNNARPVTGFFADSTELLPQADVLKARAAEDGFLFFHGMLPRERVLQLRLDILQILERYGVMDANSPLIEGNANVEAVNRYNAVDLQWNGVGVTFEMYKEIQSLESFHALAHSPEIKAMFRSLLGMEAFPHPRNIGRVMLPHADNKVTPSHQDFLHIQGAENTWTCWIPLGDVSIALGGLCVLKGSHKSGLLGVIENPGAGGLESILCGLDYEWQTADYKAGDVLVFHSHTVHKALPNQIDGKIRISCDYRYQPANEVIGEASLAPHGPYEWDDLYKGWEREDLQYYWKNQSFAFSPFDESIRWQKEKIC